ncbi:protein kinase domain-containing protein [Bacillus alveayuensis]|uniref:Serine/threonine-protein kinase n=1 Tax=Aeribacillus alveayuensis TaxID=279215 RepID=A0ABT9VR90_9BACI|nr:serine/threonine-protein kinase [Bacillus alveayuensis]MDQ0163400.1 serine/threonine-protein kinase [Bacillus alveayuensis]
MMNISMNNNFNISSGTIIKGKWHGNCYRIINILGSGAIGHVYLAECRHGKVALKLSENSMGITSEVNVLKCLAKVQGSSLGPSLVDVDDYFHPELQKHIPFYVMEYIKGEHFIQFIENRGTEWIDILILQLLTNLAELHRFGWVFGDLKPDNLIVTFPPPKIRCIDVGGTTRIGRSIKEFTEFFDRGHWELGIRKAEPSYDLFAVAMIIFNAVYPKRFKKIGKGKDQLLQLMNSHSFLQQRKSVLTKALLGSYTSALEMKEDLLKTIVANRNLRNVSYPLRVNKSQPQSYSKNRKQVKKKKRRKRFFLETFLLLICLALLYSFYILTNLL